MSLPFEFLNVPSISVVDDSLEEVIQHLEKGSAGNPIDLTMDDDDKEEIIDLTGEDPCTPNNTPVKTPKRIHPHKVEAPEPRNIGVPPRIQGMVNLGFEQGVISADERNDIDYWLNTPSPTKPFKTANMVYRQNRGMRAFDKLVSHYCG